MGVKQHDVGASADHDVVHRPAHKRRCISGCERHRLCEFLVGSHPVLARKLQRDPHHVAVTIGTPEVADAIGAESECNATFKHSAPRQGLHSHGRDRAPRDTCLGDAVEQPCLASALHIAERKAVSNVDLTLQPCAQGAIDDEFDLKRTEFAAVMQVNVEANAATLRDLEQAIELTDRVAVDAGRVDAANRSRALGRGLIEQLQHPGTAHNAVLWERHDVEGNRAAEYTLHLADHLNTAQSHTKVNVDVGSHGRRSVPHELARQRERELNTRHAEAVTLLALVGDPTLGRRLAGVGLPRQSPPGLVNVSMRVDEPGSGDQPGAIKTLDCGIHVAFKRRPRRNDLGDELAFESEIDGGLAPWAHIAEDQRHTKTLTDASPDAAIDGRLAREASNADHGVMTTVFAEKAAALLALHAGAGFVLPNAWDAGSARMLEQIGFSAIATTSAGIAWANGVPDGGAMDRDTMLEHVARIAAAVSIPVSADLESGYSDTSEGVGYTVARAAALGAVGANIEDANGGGLFPLDAAVARVAAARAAAPKGTFVLNARTDTYFAGANDDVFDQTIERAVRYLDAGADCIFVPGVVDPETIGRLAAAIPGPLNIVAGLANVIDAPTLFSLGVTRVSLGGSLARAALSMLDRAGRELLETGTLSFLDGAISYSEVQRRFGTP